MDNQEIKRKLRQINLNLDSEIIQIVPNYLVNEIGFISDIEPEYQIYAALAIISQSRTLPNIGHEGFSKNGINIQNVMSHLGKLSKERFLDTLNKQLEKLKRAPQNLKKRVEDIRYSYRFYKKYQTTFEALFEHLIPNKSSKQDFNAFFWVLYLYIKNSYVECENITEAKSLLILIFRAIFESYICRANFNDIFFIMEQKIGAIPQISVEKHEFYLQKIGQKMDNFYSQRYSQSHTNFDKLTGNSIYLERLVDDMSNAYAKEKTTLRYYNEIDELSYLELNKNLTPQVFRKHIPEDNIQVINTHLCFDEDQDDMDKQIDQKEPITGTPVKKPHVIGEIKSILTPTNNASVTNLVSPISTPKWPTLIIPKISPITLFDDRQQSTPITKKIHSEMWINDKIGSITSENLKQFETMFTYLDNRSELIEESATIYISLKEKINKSIKDYTPKCHDYEERFLKIFSFFLSNFIEIEKNIHSIHDQKNESDQVQRMKKRIIGIATLSCEIFNYVHNAISYEFKHHLEVFETDIKVAIQVFELFEKFVSKKMPIDLKSYVHNTRKRFLVNDIWQNEQGFKLLYYVQNNTELTLIRGKIIDNTEDRIRQICRQAGIKPKIVSKTTNMMKFILENKSYLLRNNNIDQIILCCLMSCLSINQKQEHQTLQLLFGQYNSNIKFSFNSNRVGLKDNLGNEMKIVEFYNDFFLNEIQDMLTEKQDQLDDFLLTPVRITQQYSLANMSQNFNMMKQKQVPGGLMYNPDKGNNSRRSYRQNILRQNFDMKEEKQENEQDIPSPTFGRQFTLGPDSPQ